MAPPSKWSPELQDEICQLVRSGVRPEAAAGSRGIVRSTHYEWMQRREEYRTAVTRAVDEFEADATRDILGGDDKGESFGKAKAALEVLSRRMPRQWAQQVKHHIETVEDEFLTTLEQVCKDPTVHERVRSEENCSFVFIAFCEALSRLDGEEEAAGDTIGPSAAVH